MCDEYPDAWKPAADRQTAAGSGRRYGSTGSGSRFPLTVAPASLYPSGWLGSRDAIVIDGVVPVGEDD